jgi:hypothetical protein
LIERRYEPVYSDFDTDDRIVTSKGVAGASADASIIG